MANKMERCAARHRRIRGNGSADRFSLALTHSRGVDRDGRCNRCRRILVGAQ